MKDIYKRSEIVRESKILVEYQIYGACLLRSRLLLLLPLECKDDPDLH